jgi:hypothetical protein
VSEAQSLLQPVSVHTYGAHECVSGVPQLPMPSHVAALVNLSVAHAAALHVFVTPFANATHDVVSVPSHAIALHTSLPPLLHAARIPCGFPVTGTHLPKLPGALQASHCPSHADSQQ